VAYVPSLHPAAWTEGSGVNDLEWRGHLWVGFLVVIAFVVLLALPGA
jgi:hypothetical protein